MYRLVEVLRRQRRWFTLAAVAIVALLGFEALRLVLHEVHLSDVRSAIALVPRWRIAVAVGLTILSYFSLTLYDVLALRTIGRPQPWRVAAAASFASYTLSHNLGLSPLTGGSARYRIYSAAGLDIVDVARVSAIAGITFWAGVLATAGLALVLAPSRIVVGNVAVGASSARLLGLALLLVLAAAPIAWACGCRALGSGKMRLPLPTPRRQAGLAMVSMIDLAAASAVLFVLVPGLSPAAFPAFFIAYALAVVIALLSHVPGGLGVFEAIVLTAMPANHSAVFAALILYRLIYYLLPLLVAGIGIAVVEARRLRRPIGRGLSLVDRAGQILAPTAVTMLAFIGGFVLLVSGALPGVADRLGHLNRIVPLSFIEGSHFAGSLAGTALLLVAPALGARLRSGWEAARILLVAGALFSLLKGFDYEEAALQLAVLAVLQYARPGFYRRGSLATEPLDLRWLAAAAAAVALSIWAGFFAYKLTPYQDALWWQFAIDGNAPRFLRASFGAGVLVAGAALWRLLAGRAMIPSAISPDKDVIARALAGATRTDANLAFTGDKSFIVSASGDALLMYRVQGRTWVVMGDPVGPPEAWSELVWIIRRACDAAGGRLCFYQASQAMLPLFVDLSLDAMKYGEEAQLLLDRFTLAGPRAKALRHALRRTAEAGVRFEIIAAARVPEVIEELRLVSEAWLADKLGPEKRFSLGAFDPDYLSRFDCAVLRQSGRIVAFANIWTLPDGVELSVDLMRQIPDAPYGTMETLFVRLFEWGLAHGYQRFDLGMAPLAGLTADRLAPLWARLGRALFDNGERIYGFAGLRAFKAKFQPCWEPRYIATPRHLGMAHALVDLARLVSDR